MLDVVDVIATSSDDGSMTTMANQPASIDSEADFQRELSARIRKFPKAQRPEVMRQVLAAVPEAAPDPFADLVGPVYFTADVERLLGRTRQALNQNRSLIRFRVGQTSAFPAFQFTGRTPRADVGEIARAFAKASVDGATMAVWFMTPAEADGADERTPLQLLEAGERETAHRAQRMSLARWSA